MDPQQAVYRPLYVSRLRVIDMSRATKDEVAALSQGMRQKSCWRQLGANLLVSCRSFESDFPPRL